MLNPRDRLSEHQRRAQRSFRLGLSGNRYWKTRTTTGGSSAKKIGVGGAMIRFWVAIAIALGGILLFPLVTESASGSCHAVEKRFINTIRKYGNEQDIGATLFLDVFSEATRGEVAARLVKTEYPNLLPFVGCTIVYYRAVLDDREMLKYRNLISRN